MYRANLGGKARFGKIPSRAKTSREVIELARKGNKRGRGEEIRLRGRIRVEKKGHFPVDNAAAGSRRALHRGKKKTVCIMRKPRPADGKGEMSALWGEKYHCGRGKEGDRPFGHNYRNHLVHN